ncbi:hypothetical protein SAMN04489725_12915 [Alicyclobacillus hesperidum]|uniref:Uncharacterized protein n=1 Tax=Alicyclobacillus hesperidum TaxID=89784 RepID=A0A1H2Y6P6_9BACL|nr:hypothetical protein [Alicyclobacillus hesperidum]SDX00816.1 hypothetical protein SAMN04489725_12915 [Alicyclobacillus hesperidum]
MVNMSNVWPNHLMDWLWLVVFIAFLLGSYPHGKGHHKGGEGK